MLKYLSLFSGIGAFEKALTNQKIPFELIGYSEIDKFASKSYSEIHGVSESMNFGDITTIDETKLPEIDFITYGFPCQDISLGGYRKGFLNNDGTSTRSGLFFEALRIIEKTKPPIAIAENVRNLISKNLEEEFNIVLDSLEAAGYNSYWKLLNPIDFGIPQHRKRIFIVSIRKDIDIGFEFPEGFPLKLKLKDMLDEEVDEKYYLNEIALNGIKNTNFDSKKRIIQNKDYCEALLARDFKDPKCVEITVGKTQNPRARRLTPKEYFRLQGFDDEDFKKCSCSNRQLYKQVGNSICVKVLEAIYKQLVSYGYIKTSDETESAHG